MISAVFDCVVYVQAAINDRGPTAACLLLAERSQIKVIASAAVRAEVKGTLSSQKLRVRYSHLTDERVEEFLLHIEQISDTISEIPSVFALTRDPDDAMYVDLALAAQASFLVSRDKDLLDLMNDHVFRQTYPGLTIIDPMTFLAHVRTESAEKNPG